MNGSDKFSKQELTEIIKQMEQEKQGALRCSMTLLVRLINCSCFGYAMNCRHQSGYVNCGKSVSMNPVG